MKRSKECSCCGSTLTAYSENLSKGYISSLRKLVDFFEKHLESVKASDPRLWLTHTQYPTIQKLKYWGLVEKGGGNTWRPTKLGRDFIYWKSAIQNIVAHIWDKILPIYHEARSTQKKKPKAVYVREVDETQYKQRADYADEKYAQGTLDQSPLFT